MEFKERAYFHHTSMNETSIGFFRKHIYTISMNSKRSDKTLKRGRLLSLKWMLAK